MKVNSKAFAIPTLTATISNWHYLYKAAVRIEIANALELTFVL